MTRIQPHEFAKFLRAYRFVGGALRAARVRHRGPREAEVEFRLLVREAITELGTEPQRVRLRIVVAGASEYRLQMRPAQPKAKLTDARLSYLNGLFYVSFDSVGLEPNEKAAVFDFRASEVYAAGRELLWELEPPRGAPADKP